MSETAPPASALAADRYLSDTDALAQLSFLIVRTVEARASEHDLSLVQTRLLGILRDREPTMNALATLLDLDKSSVTGLVDRAERRGLVERVPSTADRRAVNVRLTKAGRSLVTRAATDFADDVAAYLDCLEPGEREILARLAERVLIRHDGLA